LQDRKKGGSNAQLTLMPVFPVSWAFNDLAKPKIAPFVAV
jgi:hypothetical protein